MRGRWWPWLLLVLALVPALLISQPHASIGGTPPTADLSEAIFQNPDTLDPALANSPSDWAVDSNIFQPLFQMTTTGKVVPALASHYSISGKAIAITIKPVALAGGGHLTATAVAAALSRPLWPQVKSATAASLLKPIVGSGQVIAGKAKYMSGITVDNATTVTIQLKRQANLNFIKALANPALSIVPVADMSRGGPDWQLTNLYGTGGYRLQNWNPGGSLTFTKISGPGPSVLSLPIFVSFKQAVLTFENQAVTLVPVNPGQLAQVPKKLLPDVRAYRQPGNLYLVYRTAAKRISVYPTVSIGEWVAKSFRGRIRPLNGQWPAGLPQGKPMTVYVNQALPEAVRLARTLERMKPGRVTVKTVSLSTLTYLAKHNKINAYIGQADLFKAGRTVPLAPLRSLWLTSPRVYGVKVYANGMLNWHSLSGKP